MVSKVAKGSIEQDAWAGDVGSLRGLIKAAGEVAEYVRDKRRVALDASRVERREQFEDSYSYLPDERREAAWIKQEEATYDKLASATKLVMAVHQNRWNLERSGDPESILAEIDDPADVREVDITFADRWSRALGGYDFRINLDTRQSNAWFEGPEAAFVDLAGARLANELRRQRPWYWWFRASWFIWIVAVPGAVAGFLFGAWLQRNGASLLEGLLSQLLIQAILIAGPYLLLRRLVLPFELVPEGKSAPSGRRFKIVGGVITWVIASLVIPIVLAYTLPSTTPPEPSPTPVQTSTPGG